MTKMSVQSYSQIKCHKWKINFSSLSMYFERKGILKLIIIGDCTHREEKGDLRGKGRKISNLKAFGIFKSIERWKVITTWVCVYVCVCTHSGTGRSQRWIFCYLPLHKIYPNISLCQIHFFAYEQHWKMLEMFHLDIQHGICCVLYRIFSTLLGVYLDVSTKPRLSLFT